MGGISIIGALPISQISASSNVDDAYFLATRSPRERWVSAPGTSHSIYVDLGAEYSLDTIYIGGALLPADVSWVLSKGSALQGPYVEDSRSSGTTRLPGSASSAHALLINRPTPTPMRHLRLDFNFAVTQAIEIGVFMAGLSWRHPYSYGSGRQLIDTSTVTDLPDGGFGIDPGVVKSGFRWRFIDLSDQQCEELWAICYKAGNRQPIVAVEDSALPLPPAASVRYGLFGKFEAYERANPDETVWSFSMTEWV